MSQKESIPTKYGSSEMIVERQLSSFDVISIWQSRLLIIIVGMLIGFGIGAGVFIIKPLPTDLHTLDNCCASNCTNICKYKQVKLMLEALIIAEKIDKFESLSAYSKATIYQLENCYQQAIDDLKQLEESLTPKQRRRPPVP